MKKAIFVIIDAGALFGMLAFLCSEVGLSSGWWTWFYAPHWFLASLFLGRAISAFFDLLKRVE